MSSSNKYLTPQRQANSTSSKNIKSITKNINNQTTNKEFIKGFKQTLKNIFNEAFNVPTSTKRSAIKRTPPIRKYFEVVSNLKRFKPSPQLLNSNNKKAKARPLIYRSRKINFNSNNNNNVVQKVKRKK